jgi:hypothetical protein
MTEFPGRVPWADESGAFGAIALTPHFRAKVRGTGHGEAQLRVCCPGFSLMPFGNYFVHAGTTEMVSGSFELC